jgi:signal recognition particle receptor subunit beta
MYIKWSSRELNIKIVYYGPAFSGKTTNLVQIFQRIVPEARSELVSLDTASGRTLFFDFLELKPRKIAGFVPKIHLYTVPGQPRYEASRKLVLRCADGVVFVADAQVERSWDNLCSWRQMKAQLEDQGIRWVNFPLVVQLNKRDIPTSVARAKFQEVMRFDTRYPLYETVAIKGEGVLATLGAIVDLVIARVQQEHDFIEKASDLEISWQL